MADIETKLSAARTRLILDKPFLGALVLRLPMTSADPKWCLTTATDARSFYYNVSYIEALSLEQTQFVLAHEALHCALSHFARRRHREKRRWDLACDFAVNPLLVQDGLSPPPNALYLAEYEGMTAEEIYPLIEEHTDQQPQDRHLYDDDNPQQQDHGGIGEYAQSDHGGGDTELDRDAGGAPQPPPLEPDERDRLETQWQQRLAGAAQQAMRAGKLSGLMARMVDHLLQPQLPWRMLLARYMTMQGREDFNYARPARREGDAILPSLRSAQVDVIVGVDTSGSISQPEMDQFLSEVNAIKGQMKARITLLPCDVQLAFGSPWTFEAWEQVRLPAKIQGGGGTSFVPVFEWVEVQNMWPDLLLYFTDAQGTFPEQEPTYPVLWVVKGKAKVPWGQRIQLN
jgi:predicted metal-dependent peptidase